MPEQNGKEYKNPAYKSDHDESGQHDTRSASSTSSVKRFLNMKLKTDGRTRWIVLIVVICVLVLIIAAICAAVVVLNSESDEHSLQNVQADNGKNVASSTTSTPKVVTSPRSAGPGTWRPKSTPKPSTQRPPDTTTPFVDLSTPKNLSAQISDIDFYPGAKTLTISCQAFHEGNLKSMDLRRQFKDGYEPLATILVSQGSETTVLVFPENISYKKIERKYELLLRVTFDPFDCGDLTNFSCAVATEEKTESAIAKITINNEPPQMEIPHSVIENKNISLECKVTLWGNESSLVWKFKPETSDAFMTFNVAPVNNITHDDCITTITTTLTFAPTMYEHGAEFRCQIEPRETDTRILRDSDYAGVILKVVPKTFCDDKRQFTINKHPFEPCSLVVYCLNTGPLVYEIVCDPGQCYDAQTTKCVDEDLVRSGSPIPPETVPVPTARNGFPIPPETVPVPSVG